MKQIQRAIFKRVQNPAPDDQKIDFAERMGAAAVACLFGVPSAFLTSP